MYKFKSYVMAMLAVGSMAFLTSCGDDEEVNPKAEIVFNPSETEVSKAPGDMVTLGVAVTSQDKLKSFKVERTILGTTATLNETTSFGNAGHSYILNDTVPSSAQPGNKIEYRFTAVTNKNETTTKTFTVNVAGVQTYTAKILGNQNASMGSSFASSNGMVYNLADAKTNSTLVDFMYYYSVGGDRAADKASLISPDHAHAADIFSAITTWTQRNTTEFKTGVSVATFNGATSGTAVQAAFTAATATASGKAMDLAVGDVIAFKTESGKHGLIHVKNITTPNSGNNNASELTVDVKVQ
ncbi:MAG: hypothetical protein EOO03_10790 [Chitinophagaceae bacterium]|nr:MAG: hypothetical protein EOO03_10790 [Chitinophagaceae bacterium]